MAVTTHTPPPRAPGADRTTGSGAETRLPWWALALPVLAFMTLLLLILNPADAQAAAEQPGIVHLLERLRQLILR
ncbi:hypothetical protein IW294_21580 [Streptomyces olivaceus]|uniref:hypothetical protein n=1 Tax=Streptomyces olivaceus TaxID=47716 RepID=UPI0018A83270|nr:hypothetical protein [Streptomyces olivaceus]MBF8173342.1 hypothetical protein [Streptomyces olivaceus]